MALIRILGFFWDDSLLGSAQNIYFASSSEKTTTRRSVHLRLPRAGWAEQCSAVAEVPGLDAPLERQSLCSKFSKENQCFQKRGQKTNLEL